MTFSRFTSPGLPYSLPPIYFAGATSSSQRAIKDLLICMVNVVPCEHSDKQSQWGQYRQHRARSARRDSNAESGCYVVDELGKSGVVACLGSMVMLSFDS